MKYTIIELSGGIRETGKLSKNITLNRGKQFRMDEYRALVEGLLKSDKKGRILVDCKSDFHPQFFAGLVIVRKELGRLKDCGYELHFYGRDFSPVQLYLASVCNYRYINLCGTVSYLGLARTFNFFKGTLDNNGIEIQVFRRGKYKSANDSFRLKKLDPANREQWEAIFEAMERELKAGILSGYGKEEGEIDVLLSGRMLSSAEAVNEAWADEILTAGELENRWKKEKLKKKKVKSGQTTYGSGSGIAVLHFEGGIMEGSSKQDPLMGQVLGTDSFLPEIKRLKKSRKVKGIVLRVNCPGGSPVASDEVAAALEDLAEKKPLVVSMADVAGSGGYWISTLGRRIFTEAVTVTGSIGVVAMMIQAGKLMKRWGINQDSIKTGPLADMGSVGRAMTAGEKKIMDRRIESLYSIFVKRVARQRNSSEEAIDKIAQGRVWTGAEAVELGLADEIGGLSEAIDYLRSEIGTKSVKVNHYPEIKSSFIERQLTKATPGASMTFGSGVSAFLLNHLSSLLLKTRVSCDSTESLSGKPLLFIPEFFWRDPGTSVNFD
ncbi:MAG: signal peptide peptidase SppA [Spirochaetales bacterium]|nr:signal peptide peptidase SppA [Spirochaetales bacterium]